MIERQLLSILAADGVSVRFIAVRGIFFQDFEDGCCVARLLRKILHSFCESLQRRPRNRTVYGKC
jgi:hypothetical protein